jgi:hypothetical protein
MACSPKGENRKCRKVPKKLLTKIINKKEATDF